MTHVAIVRFYFEDKPIFECFVYTCNNWQGEPVETDEMRPEWFPLEQIPYEHMWDADKRWLPMILKGETFEATVVFNADGSALKKFESKPVIFER